LLDTELTELERQFISRRLSEERSALKKVAASAFPLAFQMRVPAVETLAPDAIGGHG
jgi:hypothetical protein